LHNQIMSHSQLVSSYISKLKLPEVKMGRFESLTPMFQKINLRKTNRICYSKSRVMGFLRSSNKEIKKMNNDKVGAPFQYSDSYVQFLAFLKIGLKIPYRMV
ncbi:MAG: hypothetical protein WCF03_11295, partial [Nitrososphaeraceae archaeon]